MSCRDLDRSFANFLKKLALKQRDRLSSIVFSNSLKVTYLIHLK